MKSPSKSSPSKSTTHPANAPDSIGGDRCRVNGGIDGDSHGAVVAAACRAIDAAAEMPTLSALAREAGLSRFHFHRVFAKVAGLTPKEYAMARRAERVRRELAQRDSVTEAIYESGFHSNSRFYAKASPMLGMAPKRYRNGGHGEVIRFAVGQCSLGSILVAGSATGVCAILLGDDPNELAENLQDRFSKAQLLGGDGRFEQWVAGVIGLVEAPASGCRLPLDVRGTVFQCRVWKALREIPPGSTASYAEIANRIGSPTSARAVAGACASNPMAVAIPCHRVVRTDGRLSGYRWGVERKRMLLEREGATRAAT